ncbi:hypothetical protein ILYODFUR_005903 [Ilyodon furcidens]|uniref:Uncharacterized protein n=1 Tax=Ilyodon furcidens TaxID=33524 RepID=A0ABV0U326_9TELE
MNCNEQVLRSGGKQQCGETGNSVIETMRCNPEDLDGCDAERTGSVERRKPVEEVMNQSPQEAWNGKGESTNDHQNPGWYEGNP